MTKAQLKMKLRNLNEPCSNRAIASLFGIREQAVQAWKSLPPRRVLQLMKKRPELFA